MISGNPDDFLCSSQVNRIKIPKQLDEFVEMESESGNAVAKFFFRMKAEIHGVNMVLFKSPLCLLPVGFFLISFTSHRCSIFRST